MSVPSWLVLVVVNATACCILLHLQKKTLICFFANWPGDERPRLLPGNAGLRWYDDGNSHSGRRAVRISRSGS